MQRIPQIWPGWHADELIGQGGFGKVYRASRELGGYTTVAAIKVIDIPRDEAEIEALHAMNMDALSIRSYFEDTARSVMGEIATMDALKGSPHVVHIEDYQLMEREDGVGWSIFIRMELLESLESHLKAHGMPDAREAARIGIELCDALQSCHDANIIHRDVKPGNVFISSHGEYKLGDFGIAKRLDESTRTTKSHAGTEGFMAPEVPTGHYDKTVDIYSLGIMLYRWLNGGRPPFLPADGSVTQADLMQAQARRLSGERPPVPGGAGVPVLLARIVQKACEPKPENRWQSAERFGRSLGAWLDGKKADDADGLGDELEEAHEFAEPLPEEPYDPFSVLGSVARRGAAAEQAQEAAQREAAQREAAQAVALVAAQRAKAVEERRSAPVQPAPAPLAEQASKPAKEPAPKSDIDRLESFLGTDAGMVAAISLAPSLFLLVEGGSVIACVVIYFAMFGLFYGTIKLVGWIASKR